MSEICFARSDTVCVIVQVPFISEATQYIAALIFARLFLDNHNQVNMSVMVRFVLNYGLEITLLT